VADPAPGSRPAPELERFDTITAPRDGQPAPAATARRSTAALGVLAGVIGRDGQEHSATCTRLRNLAHADQLAVLNAIWTAETAPARQQRYRRLLTAALPAGYRDQASHKETWLWRTLRAAELAGLDPAGVLRAAAAEQDLAGARDVAAVIDARIRQRYPSLVPLRTCPWAEQVPVIADPQRRAFAGQIAKLMDERKERIGEHAAEHSLPWAIAALGPVPAGPAGRRAWQQRASSIGAYRELSGYDHPADPIGPEPAGDTPDKRAAWHEALTALGPATGTDLRGLPDGTLLHLRDTYPIETAWAPRWAGDELRQVRHGAREAHLAALRADAEARAARRRGHEQAAARHQVLADSYRAMHDIYRDRERVFAAAMDDRAKWERATARQRRLAIAADAELRRRHPGQPFEPLRSAEPEPITDTERQDLVLAPGQKIPAIAPWITELAARHHAFAGQLAERQSPAIPPEDPGHSDLSQAFPAWDTLTRDAILQPPRPLIRPSARIMARAADHDAGREAAS